MSESRFAVAVYRFDQPRFFSGKYDEKKKCFAPITTPKPDEARVYDDRLVAEVIANTFNALDGVRVGAPVKDWIVAELPEAWI